MYEHSTAAAKTWPTAEELERVRRSVGGAHNELDGLHLWAHRAELDDGTIPEQLGLLTEFLSIVSADLESMQDYVRQLSRVRDAVTLTGR